MSCPKFSGSSHERELLIFVASIALLPPAVSGFYSQVFSGVDDSQPQEKSARLKQNFPLGSAEPWFQESGAESHYGLLSSHLATET